MDQGEAVGGARARQVRRPGGVGQPRGAPAVGGLGAVDVGPRGRVDDHVEGGPVEGLHLVGVGDGDLGQVHARRLEARGGQLAHELAAQLPVRPGHQHPGAGGGGEGRDIGQARVGAVLVGQDRPLQRDRPGHRHRLVGEVEERVARVGGPVGVDQVGVRGGGLQGLVRVAHALGDEHRGARVDDGRVHGAEGGALAQVHPRAEDPPRGDGDELVPRLGVDAAGDAHLVVEGDVVLHGPEVGQPQPHHLLPLPVLLEPAPVVPVDREVDAEEPRDGSGLDPQGLSGGHHACSSSFDGASDTSNPIGRARPGAPLGGRRGRAVGHDGPGCVPRRAFTGIIGVMPAWCG